MKAEDAADREANRLFDMVRDGRSDAAITRAIAEALRRVASEERAAVVALAKKKARMPDCGACDGKGQVETGPRVQDVEDCPDCDGCGKSIDWSAFDAAVKVREGGSE